VRTIRSRRLRHIATLRDMTGRKRRHSTAPLIPAGFHSTPGTGRDSGSPQRPRLRTSSILRSNTRFWGSAKEGGRQAGSIISTSRCFPGLQTTQSRACRCCQRQQFSRWRLPPRDADGRTPLLSRSSMSNCDARCRLTKAGCASCVRCSNPTKAIGSSQAARASQASR
jgi:hypothetical protein